MNVTRCRRTDGTRRAHGEVLKTDISSSRSRFIPDFYKWKETDRQSETETVRQRQTDSGCHQERHTERGTERETDSQPEID